MPTLHQLPRGAEPDDVLGAAALRSAQADALNAEFAAAKNADDGERVFSFPRAVFAESSIGSRQ